MPWKIRDAEFEPGNPYVHFCDPAIDLHMVTSLSKGTVEVWIGHVDPAKSRFFVRISEDGADIQRAAGYHHRDLVIIDNVLGTLCASAKTRQNLLGRYFHPHNHDSV